MSDLWWLVTVLAMAVGLLFVGGLVAALVNVVSRLIRSRSHITDYYDTQDHRLDPRQSGHGHGTGGGGAGG
jgi:hypothetical protein